MKTISRIFRIFGPVDLRTVSLEDFLPSATLEVILEYVNSQISLNFCLQIVRWYYFWTKRICKDTFKFIIFAHSYF